MIQPPECPCPGPDLQRSIPWSESALALARPSKTRAGMDMCEKRPRFPAEMRIVSPRADQMSEK